MGCDKCNSCASCGGCGRAIELTEKELSLLQALGQYSFLPVARCKEDMTPVYLEDDNYDAQTYSLIVQCLEKKDLISIRYDAPLRGANMEKYSAFPIHGSMALTARGQRVLDLLDMHGIDE